MKGADGQADPVSTKAVLIEPETSTVVWMNESAAQDVQGGPGRFSGGIPLDVAVPIAETLGVPEALQTAVRTGVAQHLHTNLVSTTRGSVEIVTSVYPLPDRSVLLLMEHGWQVRQRTPADGAPRRPSHRKR